MNKYLEYINKYKWLYYSSLQRRDEKTMIFGSWLGEKYDDNSRYLYEYVLREKPGINAYWFTSSIDIYKRLKKENMPVIMSTSKEAKLLALKAKYVFTVTGKTDIGNENIKYIGGAVHVNLWHGVPLKKIMYDDKYGNPSNKNVHLMISLLLNKLPDMHYYVISTSATITKIYQSAFKIKKEHILQLGQPRNDYFFIRHDNPYRERFIGKKILLYMPTHRNEGRTQIDMQKILNLDKLDALCKQYNAVFLIKKHFYHAKEKSLIADNSSSIYEITNEMAESQVLLDAADILITDYSSCYIDYLLLDRPIIFYNFDIKEYKEKDRQLYFEYDDVTPGRKCINYESLHIEIENLLNGNDEFHKERVRIKNLFYDVNNQGIVSPQIIETVLQL